MILTGSKKMGDRNPLSSFPTTLDRLKLLIKLFALLPVVGFRAELNLIILDFVAIILAVQYWYSTNSLSHLLWPVEISTEELSSTDSSKLFIFVYILCCSQSRSSRRT